MAKEQFISVNEAVLKIQLALLKGIHEESQLFAAGSLLSRSDYEDVVTERSIVKRCGYPLCENRLAEERASRGRYRISLKEHKVYDLHETYMYCSSRCVIESRAFGGSLEEKRVGVLNSPKIGEVLKLFEELGLDKREELRERGGLGVKELKELKIEENVNVRGGEVLLEDWLGPPNAIEGYVPNLDTRLKAPTGEHGEEGLKPNKGKLKKGKGKNKGVNEMDFTSAIIVGDQFGVPKFSYGSEESYTKKKMKESKQNQFSIHEAPVPVQNSHHMQLKESNTEVNNSASKDQVGVVGTCSGSTQSVSDSSIERSKGMTLPNKTTLKSALKHSDARRLSRSVTWADEKEVSDISIANLNKTTLKPALKHSGVRRFSQIVNRADEKEVSDISIANLNNVQQIACISYGSESSSSSSTVGGIDGRPCLASDAKTELTPSQAAEAVSFSESEVTDNVRLTIERRADDGQGYTKSNKDVNKMEISLKRPKNPDALISDSLSAKDSRTSLTLVKEKSITLKDAVHKIQLSLIGGIGHEHMLLAAQSLLSRSDYDDVVTKRSIGNICGYPLCNNPLPKEWPQKNHQSKSLKQPKSRDPREMYMFCSPDCVDNSRTFARSLPVKRCSIYNAERITEIVKLFEKQGLEEEDYLGVVEDLSELKIDEKLKDGSASEVERDEAKHNTFSNDEVALSLECNGSDAKSKKSGVGSIGAAENTQFEDQKMLHVSMQNVSDIAVEDSKQISSIKPPSVERLSQSATWADTIEVSKADGSNLCASQEANDTKDNKQSRNLNVEVFVASSCLVSAEASSHVRNLVVEAVPSDEFDTSDTESDSGIIMLPQLHDYDEQESQEEDNVLELEEVPLNLPNQPDLFNSKLFDPQKSWYDAPPNGFNLNLSSFATMWTALFGWITSSSLAYIYGQDVSSHEEFMSINGKEYPRKILSSDGRSSEIKESLAGILARVVPELAAELRLRAPLSALEHGMECLLNTMSFMDRLPSLETEQWHVLTLVFIDALSVCRIPALAPQMTSMRVLLDKVLGSAQVTWEEYESMKDIIIPLGRRPQFSTQSGG